MMYHIIVCCRVDAKVDKAMVDSCKVENLRASIWGKKKKRAVDGSLIDYDVREGIIQKKMGVTT